MHDDLRLPVRSIAIHLVCCSQASQTIMREPALVQGSLLVLDYTNVGHIAVGHAALPHLRFLQNCHFLHTASLSHHVATLQTSLKPKAEKKSTKPQLI